MAKILFTAFLADARNKVNGTVFSKNKYGAYTRTKVTPANPQTGFQLEARQNLSTWTTNWRNLTQAQRDAWIAAAPNFPQTDIFGNSQTLTGSALYIRLNTNLANIGITALTSPPLPQAIPAITITGITADATPATLEVSTNATTIGAGYQVQVWATPCISPGKSFVKNLYRYLTNVDNTADDLDILSVYTDRFGALAAGQKLFVQLVVVSEVSGEQGVPVNSFTLVA